MDIYTSIADLTSTYEDLNNSLSSDYCTTAYDQVYRQESYRDAYNKLIKAGIENLAIQVVAKSVSGKVFSRLCGLIRENIHIYDTRNADFNNIAFDKLYSIWEAYLFGDKRALILQDREMIAEYPYPTEREREMLLQENRADLNNLDNERGAYRKANAAWIGKNYYVGIYGLSCSFASILNSYFPGEEETKPTVIAITSESDDSSVPIKEVTPDEIFRTRMFDKFCELEARLIKNGDLDAELHWQAKHRNDKPDIKRLVIFIMGLTDNGYFLPKRDTSIKAFFEVRYHICIGQNFERKRRESLLNEYKTVFYDYPF